MTRGGMRRFALIALWTVALVCVFEQVRTGFHVVLTAGAVYVLGLAFIVGREKGDEDE